MINHYFKVAFRNYLSNKTQSLITLFSLAVAFALIALSGYWIQYEQTYDSFLTDYENIYVVGKKNLAYNRNEIASYPELYSHLINNFSEVDKACFFGTEWEDDKLVEINNQSIQAECEEVTPEAIEMFGIQWVEGNRDMNSWNEYEVAVCEEIARKVCGKDSPIGAKLIVKDKDGIEIINEYQIAAVFKTWPQHSNFSFRILKKYEPVSHPSGIVLNTTFVRLKQGTDVNKFLQKMIANPLVNNRGQEVIYNVLIPLSKLHYTFPKEKRNIRLNDVKLFAGAAILLSVCALLNYLTLFLSRLRNRGRDMALRTICGSSAWQTGALLMVEYLLLLLGSLIFSILVIELFYNDFLKLSQLEINRTTVYTGCGYLLLFILGFATILSLVPILYFKNKTLRMQIDSTPIRLGRNRFRIAGVCMQLFISLLFIFCSTVMIKQIHYLIHADINIERKNIAWLSAPFSEDIMMSAIQQVPLVTEALKVTTPIFPANSILLIELQGFEGRVDLVINSYQARVNRNIARFYGLKMKEGPESFDLKQNEVLINETFAKQLNEPNPIGKSFLFGTKNVIKGIVYDFQYQNPTKPTPAMFFSPEMEIKNPYFNTIAFKYLGDFADCQAALKNVFDKLEPNTEDEFAQLLQKKKYSLRIEDGETVYNSYLTSEFNLLKLLGIITCISLLIALFGVYALILQECERQRKNIAIRKVYGAQVKDILMMFFKEYMLQVALAAVLAFPIGYVLMKHWLEGYSRQIGISIDIYLGIFIGMALLVILCIGWHVWRAANEDPATAVKKE